MNSLSSTPPVRVNVRLCGAVPRNELDLDPQQQQSHHHFTTQMHPRTSSPPTMPMDCQDSSSSLESMATELSSQLGGLYEQRQQQLAARRASSPPTVSPPSWAVPACGESRLEPLCESLHIHQAVDLTERACFYVGRSPSNDVQLLHETSSRRHALLFHHSNGSCYIVDCGSAHGTFVNGVRVTNPATGKVVPTRIRRGSIVRFGGPGAPSFMLKSFEFGLDDLQRRDSFEASMEMPSTPDMHQLVECNTRINSLGQTAKDSLHLPQFPQLTSKRSFEDSMDTDVEVQQEDHRCSSPVLTNASTQPMRLVSPDGDSSDQSASAPYKKRRRVSFSSEPPAAMYPSLISPDLSGDEN